MEVIVILLNLGTLLPPPTPHTYLSITKKKTEKNHGKTNVVWIAFFSAEKEGKIHTHTYSTCVEKCKYIESTEARCSFTRSM